MFQTSVVEKIKTYFGRRKSCLLRDNMEKCCRDGQDTDDNMANAHWMLDN